MSLQSISNNISNVNVVIYNIVRNEDGTMNVVETTPELSNQLCKYIQSRYKVAIPVITREVDTEYKTCDWTIVEKDEKLFLHWTIGRDYYSIDSFPEHMQQKTFLGYPKESSRGLKFEVEIVSYSVKTYMDHMCVTQWKFHTPFYTNSFTSNGITFDIIFPYTITAVSTNCKQSTQMIDNLLLTYQIVNMSMKISPNKDPQRKRSTVTFAEILTEVCEYSRDNDEVKSPFNNLEVEHVTNHPLSNYMA